MCKINIIHLILQNPVMGISRVDQDNPPLTITEMDMNLSIYPALIVQLSTV
jgi:hypothetical protein